MACLIRSAGRNRAPARCRPRLGWLLDHLAAAGPSQRRRPAHRARAEAREPRGRGI